MPRVANAPKKTPAEQLAEVDAQLAGLALRAEELSLHQQTLELRRRKILTRNPDLASEEGEQPASED